MAGRPRNIDRNKVLDAAEAVVAKQGAAALSFDSVAREAGITKSGVQYCFGTKDRLIRAMYDRWERAFDQDVAARMSGDDSARALVRAQLDVVRDSVDAEYSRSAALMTLALHHPDQMSGARDWYAGRLARLDLSRAEDRTIALVLLAAEGAFMLRAFGLLALEGDDWNRLFADLSDRLDQAGPDPATGTAT